MVSGPRQIGNYPSARARSPRLRLIDFFRGANARHFRRDRDRENRDGPIERLRGEEASRWKAGPKRLETTLGLASHEIYVCRARVDDHDDRDKMVGDDDRMGGRRGGRENEEKGANWSWFSL